MDPVLVSCRHLLATLLGLIDLVRGRASIADVHPDLYTRTIARNLALGLTRVEAFLRRVLLVMALEIEPTLVDVQKPMRRPHRRVTFQRPARFKVLQDYDNPMPEDVVAALRYSARQGRKPRKLLPVPVALRRLHRRLDQLAAIAANPLARARRLAFFLARSRPGLILAPDRQLRMSSHWGTDASILFDAMAYDIFTRSRARPPPFEPPRLRYPSVTLI